MTDLVARAMQTFIPALLGVLVATSAGIAHAAALSFTASLAIQIEDLPPVVTFGTGTAIANGSAGGSHINSLALAGSTFATTAATPPIWDPGEFPIAGLRLTVHNGSVDFGDVGGTLGGVMPLAGFAKLCFFGTCSAAVGNLSIPLSVVGQGGEFAQTDPRANGLNYTVIGAPWTTGTATAAGRTAMGSAQGPASATSSTFAPGGQLTLVTPIFISTSIGAFRVVPAFGILTLHFIPEPATIALLAGGIGVLGAIGRARRG